jgi:predicted cupin superfamily sugar epimerase
VEVADVVRHYGLEPHPEGGWYRRTWEDRAVDAGGRRRGSAILFLLGPGEESRWHRIDATELWHHGAGGPLVLSRWVEGDDGVTSDVLGADGSAGHLPQVVVAPGEWQRARADGAWALVSCVVVPEFRFEGFELAPDGWEPPTPTLPNSGHL